MSSKVMRNSVAFTNEMTVRLVRSMANDNVVVQAAQVSALGENNPGTDKERLVRALLKGRHGSPFEHAVFTFFVEAPLFVFREWQRHRMSSFNEMSGRYTELFPKFYIPGQDRAMVLSGTKMKPSFIFGSEGMTGDEINFAVRSELETNSQRAWKTYRSLLDMDIAPEVARMSLPLNMYSQMYWTVNARSLMNFLSLRVESDESLVRSYPQKEIQNCANLVEDIFKEAMPFTHKAFVDNGRVAP